MALMWPVLNCGCWNLRVGLKRVGISRGFPANLYICKPSIKEKNGFEEKTKHTPYSSPPPSWHRWNRSPGTAGALQSLPSLSSEDNTNTITYGGSTKMHFKAFRRAIIFFLPIFRDLPPPSKKWVDKLPPFRKKFRLFCWCVRDWMGSSLWAGSYLKTLRC